jgi:hypothetical protein
VRETMLVPPTHAQEAPREPPEPGSVPASMTDAESLKQEAYPVRWLRGHYPLSRAVAKIVAAELRMVGAE